MNINDQDDTFPDLSNDLISDADSTKIKLVVFAILLLAGITFWVTRHPQ
jgi:hypothetical protein